MKYNAVLAESHLKKLISSHILKENDDIQQAIDDSILVDNTKKNDVHSGRHNRLGKYMKIFIYLIFLSGIGLALNSCMGGYVASEPSYSQYDRPQRPSEAHFWIDGDWDWNSRSHSYVQRAGYWEKPRIGQTYVTGSWQSNQHGKTWSKGHWQRDSQQRYNQQRNRRQRDNYQRDDHDRDNGYTDNPDR